MKYAQSIVLGCIGAATLASAIPTAARISKHRAHKDVATTEPLSETNNVQQRDYEDDLLFLRDFFDDVLSSRGLDADEELEIRAALKAAAPKVKASTPQTTPAKSTAPAAGHKQATANHHTAAGTKPAGTKPHQSNTHAGGKAHSGLKPAQVNAHRGGKTTTGTHAAGAHGALNGHKSTTGKPATGAHGALNGHKSTTGKPHGTLNGHKSTTGKPAAGAHGALNGHKSTMGKPLNTHVKPGAGVKGPKPTNGKPAPGAHGLNTKPNPGHRGVKTPNGKPTNGKPATGVKKPIKKPVDRNTQLLANSQKQHTNDVKTQQRLQGQLKGEKSTIDRLQREEDMWKYRAEGLRAAHTNSAPSQWRRDIEDDVDLFERELDFDELDARDFDFDEFDARDFDEEDLEMRFIEDFEIDELD